MSRLEQIRLRKTEKKVADVIALPIALILAILFYIGKLGVTTLYRFKKQIYKLSLMVAVVFFLTNVFGVVVSAPKAKAELDTPVAGQSAQLSEHDQIKAYIKEVFKDQASNAFKILACENHALNPNAQGHNTNGTTDTGIFQVNSIWANPQVLTNWKLNVDMAHIIYLRGGWNEWSCESVYHALERNDTI